MNRAIAPAIRAMATINCTMNPAPPKNSPATGEQATKRTPRTIRIMPKKTFRKVTILDESSTDVGTTSIDHLSMRHAVVVAAMSG